MSTRPPLAHSSTNTRSSSYRANSPGSFSQSFPPSSISSPTQLPETYFHNPSMATLPEMHRYGSNARKLKSLGIRRGRGMTYVEAWKGGIISDVQQSQLFEDMPVSEDEIAKLPKKLRPYYEKMAVLHAHYVEVDSILSGSLPQNVALSFTPAPTFTQRIGDLEEEAASPGWDRSSFWRVNGEGGEEDADETTALLGDKAQKRERLARIALNINTIVNVILVTAKAVAVLYSASISLAASLVDSSLDLLSTLIILGTSWAIGRKSDGKSYPAGKRRFEPLGVLIFSVAMIASFVQVFIESFQRTVGPAEDRPIDVGPLGIGVMLATIAIKLVLWLWCSRIPSSGVQALAQDAENDVFFNIMSLAFPWIGAFMHWRLLDPIGGMVLSAYIIVEWMKTLHENFAKLSGKSAPADQIARVLYLVSRFNPVLEIGDAECYHIGDDLIVEVDVILPRSSTLHFAHDVGETIQCVLESLDGVIRAYVHCDYSSSNPQQHTARGPKAYPITRTARSSSSSDYGSGTPTPKASQQYPGLDGLYNGESREAVEEVCEDPGENDGAGGRTKGHTGK